MAGYGDDTAFTAWAAANGFTLPGSPSKAILRQRGSAYLDGLYGSRFSGVPTGGYAQERAFPRTGATAYGASIPDDVIPEAIIEASYFAAYQEVVSPGSLSVVSSSAANVKREKVGALEVEYFSGMESGAATAAPPLLSAIEGLVAPFLLGQAPKIGLGILSIGR